MPQIQDENTKMGITHEKETSNKGSYFVVFLTHLIG